MADPQRPKSHIFHGAGGAMDGAYILECLLFICEHTGLEPYQLFDFFIGESISSIFVGALNTKHPQDPNRALLTIRELYDQFYEKAEDLLPYPGFRGYLKIIFNSRTGYLDKQKLAGELHNIFGNATLGDSLKGQIITSYKLGPGKHGPHHFTHIPEGLLYESLTCSSLVHAPHLTIEQTSLAATAHGVFIGSHEIEMPDGSNTIHTDIASVANRSAEILDIAHCLEPGMDAEYHYFGTGQRSGTLTREAIRKFDIAGLLTLRKFAFYQDISTAAAKHAQFETLKHPRALGPENVHVLDMDIAEMIARGIKVPVNLIDSRKETMQARQSTAKIFVNDDTDRVKRRADTLSANYHLKTRISDPTTGRIVSTKTDPATVDPVEAGMPPPIDAPSLPDHIAA